MAAFFMYIYMLEIYHQKKPILGEPGMNARL
jgi:hypothetical protein